MKVFARLARKIMHEEFREALRKEHNPETLLRFLKESVELD
jgi:mannitol/fructose-specific phosphotransferase system IIA component (Ntr-type)